MKKWITLLVSVLCVQLTYSQFDVELGECDQGYNDKTEAQVNKALSSFEKKDYRMAKIYVNNILEMDPKNAHGLYLMGEVAMRGKPANVNKAIAYWSQLIDVCPNYRAEVQFFLGVLLLENGNKKKSEEMMKLFLANPERDRGFDKEAESILEEIHLQETLFANPVPFDPKPIMSICTRDDEYLAVISPDAELCFFTRRSKKVDKYSGPAAKTRIVEEFVMAKRNEDGSFEKGDALGYPFNENYNEGGPTITANNRELYFTVCQRDKTGAQNCDIYYCIREGLYWGEIENLGDHINTEAWESQPSVSADGKTLYFVS
ncbi:MAG: hypothetical protein N4A46_01400, partial [Schleiferiaceae bacterium]|nr:hypothetical protein [Schleiferiaceae bacterium]